MTVLPAHRVATPVLDRLATAGQLPGVVLGAGATAAWVDLDGFVVAVTTREVPLLPNAIALATGSGTLSGPGVAPGATASLAPGRIALGSLRITWDPTAPPTWNPSVPAPTGSTPEAVARRGAALLHALGVSADPNTAQAAEAAERAVDSHEDPNPPAALVRGLARVGLDTAADPGGAEGLALLFRGVRERDPVPATRGAGELLGRGPGLTPEGDDLLAGVAGTLAVLGPVAGLDGPLLSSLLAALVPPPGRTTALSATLLELAGRGLLAEPAGRLLDLGPAGEAAWPAALRRLERLGHGSGRAYAAGIAAASSLLAAGAPVR